MKVNYKNCEIECFREDNMLYYSVFDNGFEVDSGFSDSEDTERSWIESLKKMVDDYREHPECYIDYKKCETLQINNEEDDNNNEDEEKYVITPEGIATISLLRCGLVNDMNDPRINGFWTLFENDMGKCGYMTEEDTEC